MERLLGSDSRVFWRLSGGGDILPSVNIPVPTRFPEMLICPLSPLPEFISWIVSMQSFALNKFQTFSRLLFLYTIFVKAVSSSLRQSALLSREQTAMILAHFTIVYAGHNLMRCLVNHSTHDSDMPCQKVQKVLSCKPNPSEQG